VKLFALFAFAASGCSFSLSFESDDSGLPALHDGAVDAPIDARIDAAVIDAAPPIDAGPDAMQTWVQIETITIPCNGTNVMSTNLLASGVTYRLRASGTCIANDNNNSGADAEYVGYNFLNGPFDTSSNVDCGIAVNDTTPGQDKLPDWGAYTSSHNYQTMWMGLGARITVMFHDPDFDNNEGSLTLAIDAFQ
jgi:hypothetical protein